jgi:hypothetical protein
MTEPSLCNLLDDVGFSSVMTCQNPYYKTMFDRKTYLAIRSEKIDTLASYPMPQGVQSRHPEQKDLAVVEPINKLPAVGIFSPRPPKHRPTARTSRLKSLTNLQCQRLGRPWGRR